ncbi:pyrimidine dimer DNA glycosylase/endonuclease V [Nitrosomonas communis]|uniref:pyrimidine dimer DNA glycosylase/endonuclease V n=1 Tax=Nitrosomonas communis TaxID=44574 RepID=UPI003D2D9100
MRLWTLHPSYLDARGLVALWREALLAQAGLGRTTGGYQHHPQLARFRATPSPAAAIAAYLREVHAEADRRGYRFNAQLIGHFGPVEQIPVSEGQLNIEWLHLKEKLEARDPTWLKQFLGVVRPDPHPLFVIVPGEKEWWERASPGNQE